MKTMMIVCALLSFALFGCRDGEGPPGKDGAPGAQGPAGEKGAPGEPGAAAMKSGDRLKVHSLVFDDGAQWDTHLVDSKYQKPCGIVLAADGERRCIPNDALIVQFSDSECSKPIGYRFETSCTEVALFAVAYPDGACGPATAYRVTGKIDAPSPAFNTGANGECAQAGTPPNAQYYDLAEEPAESFVGVDEVIH